LAQERNQAEVSSGGGRGGAGHRAGRPRRRPRPARQQTRDGWPGGPAALV